MKKFFLYQFLLFRIISTAQFFEEKEVEFRIVIPEISLVNIVPEDNLVVFDINNLSNPGEKIEYTSSSNSKLWLNYTSSNSPETPSKNLSVQIISGFIPKGLELKIKLSEYAGSGYGKFGFPSNGIFLKEYPQIILSDIGGCFTNKGVNNGHRIEYILVVSNFKLLDATNSSTLNIVYTLTDN